MQSILPSDLPAFTEDDFLASAEHSVSVTSSLLGAGAFGVVVEGLHPTHGIVAVKFQALPQEVTK